MTVERETSLVIGKIEIKLPWSRVLPQDIPQKLATLKPIGMDVVITRTLTPTSLGADVRYSANGNERYGDALEQYLGKGLDNAVVRSERKIGLVRIRKTYKWEEKMGKKGIFKSIFSRLTFKK